MTVQELISELQKHPPEMRLAYWAEEHGTERWMLLEFDSGFSVATVDKSKDENRHMPVHAERVLLLY